jgi:hypothetical protein
MQQVAIGKLLVVVVEGELGKMHGFPESCISRSWERGCVKGDEAM